MCEFRERWNIAVKGKKFFDLAVELYMEQHQFAGRVASGNKTGFKLGAAKETVHTKLQNTLLQLWKIRKRK
jgi:hypothetical protein